MRDKFPGFYITAQHAQRYWKNGVFVFDANVLLHTYLYTKSAREQFFQVLEQIKNRIWIPYQAAYEFHKHRIEVIEQIYRVETEFKKEIKAIKKQINNMKEKKVYRRHPFIEVDSLLEPLISELQRIDSKLRERNQNHPNFRSTDILFNLITRLFRGKVGSPFPKEQLLQIYEEAEFRIQNAIPPGYRDQEKTSNRYGDILIWFEILEYAKQIKKPIIFITNDEKEDWWRDQDAREPRAELINEMLEKADVPFYMYTTDRFLDTSKKLLKTESVTKETIKEIETIRKEEKTPVSSKIEDKLLKDYIASTQLVEKISALRKMVDSSITNDFKESKKVHNQLDWLLSSIHLMDLYTKNGKRINEKSEDEEDLTQEETDEMEN